MIRPFSSLSVHLLPALWHLTTLSQCCAVAICLSARGLTLCARFMFSTAPWYAHEPSSISVLLFSQSPTPAFWPWLDMPAIQNPMGCTLGFPENSHDWGILFLQATDTVQYRGPHPVTGNEPEPGDIVEIRIRCQKPSNFVSARSPV